MNNRIALLAIALVALTGCASNKWGDYAAEHSCKITEQVMTRKVTNGISSMPGVVSGVDGVGVSTGYTYTPSVRYEKLHLFRCDNGFIWVRASQLKGYDLTNPHSRDVARLSMVPAHVSEGVEHADR